MLTDIYVIDSKKQLRTRATRRAARTFDPGTPIKPAVVAQGHLDPSSLCHRAPSFGESRSDTSHGSHRQLQDRFDTRHLADRIDERLVDNVTRSDDRAFIERLDMFFLATTDEQGRPNCSYKGGGPGFVRVLDEHTLAFANYDGNGMYLSIGNTLVNPNVGMLFIDFERGRRLRINGVASIDEHDELMEHYSEAQFIVQVRAREVFPNCPRYIHKYRLVEHSRFVLKASCPTPVPDWKRSVWARDLLPANDPARDSI